MEPQDTQISHEYNEKVRKETKERDDYIYIVTVHPLLEPSQRSR